MYSANLIFGELIGKWQDGSESQAGMTLTWNLELIVWI
jgi:hypothetical protein